MANAYVDSAYLMNSGELIGVFINSASGVGAPISTGPSGVSITGTIDGTEFTIADHDIIWDDSLGYIALPVPSSIIPTSSSDVSLVVPSGLTTDAGTVASGIFDVTNLVGKNLDDVTLADITMPIGWNLQLLQSYSILPYFTNIGKVISEWFPNNNSIQVLDDNHNLVSTSSTSSCLFRCNVNNFLTGQPTGYPSLPSGWFDIEYSDFSDPPNVTQTSGYFAPTSGHYYTLLQIDADGPRKDLKVYAPGADKTQKFSPYLLDKIRGFNTIRFMDIWRTNTGSYRDLTDIANINDVTYNHSKTLTATVSGLSPYSDPDGYFQATTNWTQVKITTLDPHGFSTGHPIDLSDMSASGIFDDGSLANLNGAGYTIRVLDDHSFATKFFLKKDDGVNFTEQAVSGVATVQFPATIPLEELVDLCNTNGSNMWFALPFLFQEDDAIQCFEYIANNLDKDLMCYVEYGNEHWNFSNDFNTYSYCYGQGALLNLNASQFYTYKSGWAHDLAYPYLQDRLVRVFGSQHGGTSHTQTICDYAYANGIKIDAIAVAPYVYNQPRSTLFASLYDTFTDEQFMDLYELNVHYGNQVAAIKTHKSILHTHFPNANILCYEGGQDSGQLTSNVGSGTSDPLRLDVYRQRTTKWVYHPRMGPIHLAWLKSLQDLEVKLFVDYILTYPLKDSVYATWGKYQAYNQKPGIGDGSDGLFDNRTDYLDVANRVSVIGHAANTWSNAYSENTLVRQGLSDYFSNSMRDFIFRSQSTFEKPTDLAVALTKNAPDHTYNSTIADEVDGEGYARRSLSISDDNWDGTDDGKTWNINPIRFNQALGEWGWVSGVVLVDSSTIGSGNVISWGVLKTPRNIGIGHRFYIASSGINVSFL